MKINKKVSKCFLISDQSIKRIIHLVFTRFLFEFNEPINFLKKMGLQGYIFNGIRVMKKYLIPSLERQSCQQFIWILLLGEKANKTYIETILNFKYLKNITKSANILITTNIDYDDIIYYDAVNDVRKAININKPLVLYGYNRGVYYFEKNNKYYEFYSTYGNNGTMSIFVSLITVLNKVNGTYIIYDLWSHTRVRSNLFKAYKSFGVNKLNYEPAIFDSGEPKFVYVRQAFSHSYNNIQQKLNKARLDDFNVTYLFGNYVI